MAAERIEITHVPSPQTTGVILTRILPAANWCSANFLNRIERCCAAATTKERAAEFPFERRTLALAAGAPPPRARAAAIIKCPGDGKASREHARAGARSLREPALS